MRFPFILRTDHEEQTRLLNVIINQHENKIAEMGLQLARKDKEIQSLMDQLTSQSSHPPASQEKPKKEFKPSRLSYRSLAQSRSRETIKPQQIQPPNWKRRSRKKEELSD